MRVLMLSWEYPPLVVGGLGRHVEALARALAAGGHEVCVVCRGESGQVVDEVRDDVRVVRAAVDPIDIGFTVESLLAWAQAGEHALLRAALPVLREWHPDVVHAHDWLVAQSGVTLAAASAVPLVVTLHATEAGRHQGWLPEPLNRSIHSVERWLAGRADAVITCSQTMRDEVGPLFGLAASTVTVVPNGIDPTRWRPTARERARARARFAGDGPVLAFAGRLVHEKGVQTLLDTIHPLRETYPQLRLAVAGTGGHEAALRAHARRRRIARAVDWLGFVPETELPAVLAAADVVVVPSFYEPFGIVALEAAVVETPLVVAETGGLRDLVAAGLVSASFPAGDADALTTAIGKVLADPATAERDAARAARVVRRRFGWTAVAARTVAVYEDALRSFTTRAGTPTATL